MFLWLLACCLLLLLCWHRCCAEGAARLLLDAQVHLLIGIQSFKIAKTAVLHV
jgi:hypothetical protein